MLLHVERALFPILCNVLVDERIARTCHHGSLYAYEGLLVMVQRFRTCDHKCCRTRFSFVVLASVLLASLC